MTQAGLSEVAPRVNGQQMAMMKGKKVRLVGQVVGPEGDLYKFVAPDNLEVQVKPSAGGNYETKFVEVEGVVNGGGVLEEHSFVNFGDNFEMSNYNELCTLYHSQTGKEVFIA